MDSITFGQISPVAWLNFSKTEKPIALLDSHLKWYNHITRELSRECIATEPVYGYYDVK